VSEARSAFVYLVRENALRMKMRWPQGRTIEFETAIKDSD